MSNIRKSIAGITGAVCASLLLIGSATAADYTMKLGLTAPPKDYQHAWTPWVVLKQELEGRTGGKLAVEIFPGGQLGGLSSLVQQVRQGVIEATMASDGSFATTYPPVQVLSLPYLFVNREVAWKVLDGPFGQAMIKDMAAKTGMRPLAWMENGGFRHYSNSKREVRTPADMKGLKIRTMEIPLHMEIVKNLGASPTPIAWKELYTALQTGVADGQENAVPTFLRPKLEEVQKFMVLDGHVYSSFALLVNENWFQALPDDIKTTFEQVTPLVNATVRGLCVANEVMGLEYLAKKGVKVYAPSAAEKKLFRDATQKPAVEWLKKEIGPEWVDKALNAVASAEKELGYR